jgi:hypothetical protein
MNSKEIELVLQARLEAGDAESDALAVGQKIGGAIEQAFNGLGGKLAEKFADEFKQKISQLDLFSGAAGGGGYSTAPSQIGGAAPGQGTFPGMGGPVNTSIPLTSTTNEENVRNNNRRIGGTTSAGGAFHIPDYAEAYNPRTQGFATVLTSAMRGTSASANMDQNWMGQAGMEHAREVDDKLRKYNLYKQTAGRGSGRTTADYGLGDDFDPASLKKDLNSLSASTGQTMANTDFKKAIEDLTTALKGNEATLKAAMQKPASDRSASEQTLVDKYQERQNLEYMQKHGSDVINQLNKDADSIKVPGAQGPWYNDQQKMSKYGRGMVGVGEAISFAGNYGESWQRGQAGTAAVNNMGARDMLAGDYNGVMATALAGGYDKMKGEAQFSTGAGIVGGLVSGIGQMVVGGATAETGMGAMIGINGMRQTMSSAKDITEFDSAVAQKMNMNKSLSYGMNQELINMYGKARGNAQGAYKDAQGLGSEVNSQFLTGFRADGAPGLYDQEQNSGLSRAEIHDSMRSYARGMGGVYSGTNVLDDKGLQGGMSRTAMLRAQGFVGAEESQAGFFAGSSQTDIIGSRSRAMNFSNDSYLGMRGMGVMEEASVALLNQQGQRASMTSDSGANAQYATNSVGSYMAGNASLNNMQGMNMLSKAQNNMQDASATGSGMMGIARYRAIQEFEKKNNIKLTKDQRFRMQQGEVGEAFMKELGVKGDANEAAADFNRTNEKEGVQMYVNAVGGDRELGRSVYASQIAKERSAAGQGTVGKYADRDKAGNIIKPSADEIKRAGSIPGKPEQQQETKLEVQELSQGMKTLKEGFNVLEDAAKNAAKRLVEVSGNRMPTADEYAYSKSEAGKSEMWSAFEDTGKFGIAAPMVAGAKFIKGAAKAYGPLDPNQDDINKFTDQARAAANYKAQAPKENK